MGVGFGNGRGEDVAGFENIAGEDLAVIGRDVGSHGVGQQVGDLCFVGMPTTHSTPSIFASFFGCALGVAAGDENASRRVFAAKHGDMVDRASSSAVAVTVQVFRMTTSAASRGPRAASPRPAELRFESAPSACVARQPKFCRRSGDRPFLYSGRGGIGAKAARVGNSGGGRTVDLRASQPEPKHIGGSRLTCDHGCRLWPEPAQSRKNRHRQRYAKL